MNYLIDTHVALWWWTDVSRIPEKPRQLISNSENTINLSAASAYEILFKNSIVCRLFQLMDVWTLLELIGFGSPLIDETIRSTR